MANYRPLVYIIHGAFHQPAHFDPLVTKFKEHGYEAVCHQNASSSHPPDAIRTPESPQTQINAKDDATIHRKIIADLVESEHRQVYIVCHSYGGLVATELVTEELSSTKRAENGLQGGIIGLCYMSACLVPRGMKFDDLIPQDQPEERPLPFIEKDEKTGLLVGHISAQYYFYNDMKQEDVDYYTSLLLPQTNVFVLNGPSERAPWIYCPTTFFYCTEDNALLMKYQKKMVERAKMDALINEIEIDAGHSPFLSQVDGTVNRIISSVNWSTATN